MKWTGQVVSSFRHKETCNVIVWASVTVNLLLLQTVVQPEFLKQER